MKKISLLGFILLLIPFLFSTQPVYALGESGELAGYWQYHANISSTSQGPASNYCVQLTWDVGIDGYILDAPNNNIIPEGTYDYTYDDVLAEEYLYKIGTTNTNYPYGRYDIIDADTLNEVCVTNPTPPTDYCYNDYISMPSRYSFMSRNNINVDRDLDGTPDVCESPALVPCDSQGGDTDEDTICDDNDNCPNDHNPDQTDICGGDPCAGLGGDTDGDGVCDPVDNCPSESNPDQLDGDNDGFGDLCDTCSETTLATSFEDLSISEPLIITPFVYEGTGYGKYPEDPTIRSFEVSNNAYTGTNAMNVVPGGNPDTTGTVAVGSARIDQIYDVSSTNSVTLEFWLYSTSNPRTANDHNCDSALSVYYRLDSDPNYPNWTHRNAYCGEHKTESVGWRKSFPIAFDTSTANTIEFMFIYNLQNSTADPETFYLIDDISVYHDDTPPCCGNGTLDSGEECDDGNILSGDGCSGTCTLEPCLDNDGDGYGNPGNASCPNGPANDCDDSDDTINPGVQENCDGLDNNCSGTIDDFFTPGTNNSDADPILDCDDNCPGDTNIDQADNDGDLIGDVCDSDDDGDFISDSSDLCPYDYDVENDLGNYDWDGDGIGDACDNCPTISNVEQTDANNNGVGDDCEPDEPVGLAPPTKKDKNDPQDVIEEDTDGDGEFNSVDNCPNIANADQIDNDGDGSGDVCDDDDDNDLITDTAEISCGSDPFELNSTCEVCDEADNDLDGQTDEGFNVDGDGYTTCAGDCDDNNSLINPGITETCNGYDDDCNPATLDCGYDITVAMITDGDGAEYTYDEWLPEAGVTYNVVFAVIDSNGAVTADITLTPKPGTISSYAGAYTNDSDLDNSADIVFSSIENNTIQIISSDYAGSITINAQSLEPVVVKDIKFPKDDNGNGLPDAWEAQFNVNNVDIGSSTDDYDNDGLTNFQELRGMFWGPELIEAEPSLPYFQTTAYMPKSGNGNEHFRADPTMKDLFVKYTGFDIVTYDGTVIDNASCSGSCPFALGAAFINAGVDVHAVSLDSAPSELNIQVTTLTNNLTEAYNNIYHTIKRGVRSWDIATFGFSGVGFTNPDTGQFTYGINTRTYKKAISAYFTDSPYFDDDGLGTQYHLDSIDIVEDANDNGVDDRVKGSYESGGDGFLDGDIIEVPINYESDLSTMDIDDDGMVELPRIMYTSELNDTDEYTIEQIFKHILTHELGHSVGMDHNSIIDCLMYEYSVNWKRDNYFSDTAIGQMTISNY